MVLEGSFYELMQEVRGDQLIYLGIGVRSAGSVVKVTQRHIYGPIIICARCNGDSRFIATKYHRDKQRAMGVLIFCN